MAVSHSAVIARRVEMEHMQRFPEQTIRLNELCSYFTRFPLRFPLERMKRARQEEWALDPFCGCGTTLLAARLLGVNAVGVDSNHPATIIARAKIHKVTPEQVVERAAHVLASSRNCETPEGAFWEWCFTPGTLQALCRFRTHFMNACYNPTDSMLCALLLGMLHGANEKKTPTFFSNLLPANFAPHPDNALSVWKQRALTPPRCNVLAMIHARAHYLLAKQPVEVAGFACEADSRYFGFEEPGYIFDWVVTSPPYYGMNSYAADQWLRNWFVGGAPVPQYQTNRQISQQTPDAYIADLAMVWKNVAVVCRSGTRFIARVGDVPGVNAPPGVELLKASFHKAAAGWKVSTCRVVRNTVPHPRSRAIFKSPASWPKNETEVFARFEP